MKQFWLSVLVGVAGMLAFDASAHAAGTAPATTTNTTTTTTQTNAQPPIQVLIDGKLQTYEQPPVMIKDRTMVPLRGVFEALGAKVEWNGAATSVTATRGNTRIFLQIGSNLAEKNGLPVSIDVAPQMINDRTMVPMRFVSEALGAEVKWDGANNRVLIKTSPQVVPASTNPPPSSTFPYPINTSFINNYDNRSLKQRDETRFLVMHETVSKATARQELNYFNTQDADANSHVFLDWNEVLLTLPINEVAWAVGKPGNYFTFNIELCHASTQDQFNREWQIATQYVAQWCLTENRTPFDFVRSHHEIATTYGGTDHTDPDDYFAEFGKSMDDFRQAVSDAMQQIEAQKQV